MKDLYLKKKEALEKELETIEAMKTPVVAKIELLNELIADAERVAIPKNESLGHVDSPNPFKTL